MFFPSWPVLRALEMRGLCGVRCTGRRSALRRLYGIYATATTAGQGKLFSFQGTTAVFLSLPAAAAVFRTLARPRFCIAVASATCLWLARYRLARRPARLQAYAGNSTKTRFFPAKTR